MHSEYWKILEFKITWTPQAQEEKSKCKVQLVGMKLLLLKDRDS
tara:strand:- start:891 stop:1022 length:132 start_codon:yes stop_codon:yes gene_type:complete